MPYLEFKKLARNARTIGTAVFTILNVNLASTLTTLILKGIPKHVQKVLSKIQPTFNGSYYNRIEPREWYELWINAGYTDIYGNPIYTTPHVLGASFSGWLEDSRCQNFASFLNYQKKKNIPKAEIKERQL
jgi:hypothetical protein